MLNRALEVVLLPSSGCKHSHSHHQVVINLSGMAEFELEGCGTCRINQSKGCIIPSGSEHAFQGVGDNQMLLLNFNDALTPQMAQCTELLKHFFDHSRYFDMDVELQRLINVVVSELTHIHWYRNASSPLVQVLLNALARRVQPERALQSQDFTRSRVNMKVLDAWIVNNLAGTINVSDLARLSCLSVSQFHRRFHSVAGCSPYQYILSVRVRETIGFLQNTDRPISEIASLVGFSTQSALCKVIKKQLGKTPSQIRGE